MGIRFHCHHCEYELHVKDFQGGRRGRCPKCQGKFRIPQQDAKHSISVDADTDGAKANHATETSGDASSELETPTNSPPAEAPDNLAAELDKPALLTSEEEPSGDASAAELPRVITDAPGATWYVRPTTGGQYGPAPSQTFVQWLVEGRIERDALVWRDDWPEWVSSAQAFADYFDPQDPFQAVAPAPDLPADVPPAPTPVPAPAAPSLSERNRLGRKQRKRRRYIVFLSVLTVLFICLIIALVVVLMQQE